MLNLQVGRILQTLDAAGIANNTIVIFTSDNGGERFSDTWPFSGKKTELLEGGLRIPAIVRWPGRIPPGSTTEQVAVSMDWFPTLLEIAGAAPDPSYPPDGISLLPTLIRNSGPIPRKLFWRYTANAQRAIAEYEDWNAGMLSDDAAVSSGTPTGAQWADHYGNRPRQQ